MKIREFELNLSFSEKGNVESRIGEYGLAWLGNIVLLFGISFLVQYLQDPLLSALVGFASVGPDLRCIALQPEIIELPLPPFCLLRL